jgi:catechol 2,3-dioxygenase-like lactoylglutathione lyase family enzyme
MMIYRSISIYHTFQVFLIIWSLPCISKWTQVKALSFSKLRTTVFSTRLYSTDTDGGDHFLASQSMLSHAMLRVPSVDKTVAYWMEKGGTIRVQKERPGASNGEAQLLSAMIELGCNQQQSDDPPPCFSLELVATNKENFELGNVLSYIGVSMLLQFQNNLLGAIKGDKVESQGAEPNGIPVESSASAPGDFLSRFSLRSKDLGATEEFYTSILGMEAKGKDENMLCLRYDNDCFTAGVPTTLIFDVTTEDLEKGDCFDHLVIATRANMEEIHTRFQDEDCTIFMKPTKMFGKDVMGLLDPNGYKVILAGL